MTGLKPLYIEAISACARDGLTISETIAKVGVSWPTVRKYAAALNLTFGKASEQVAERVRALAKQGMTRREAATHLNITYFYLSAVARQHRIKFRHASIGVGVDRSRLATMAALYKDGYTLEQIGQQFGVTRERVRQCLTKYVGIRGDGGGQAVTAERNRSERNAKRELACLAQHGCSREQLKMLRALGRDLMKRGVSRERTPIGAFNCQRSNAGAREIGWELTLWQWWTIWQQSGKWHVRGRGRGYAMCRKGDTGPYAVNNVYIATCAQNSSDGGKRSNLPMGVSKHRNRYKAATSINGRKIELGSFPTPELAHAAYLIAVRPLERAA